jgi:hypothetical protein
LTDRFEERCNRPRIGELGERVGRTFGYVVAPIQQRSRQDGRRLGEMESSKHPREPPPCSLIGALKLWRDEAQFLLTQGAVLNGHLGCFADVAAHISKKK